MEKDREFDRRGGSTSFTSTHTHNQMRLWKIQGKEKKRLCSKQPIVELVCVNVEILIKKTKFTDFSFKGNV